MSKGRPKLPEGEVLVHVTIRIPGYLHEECKAKGNVSRVIRKALEHYFEPELTL